MNRSFEAEAKNRQLLEIKKAIINLESSPLYQYRVGHHYFPVIGEGNHQAKLMLIGEAPGENEAKTGRPFCGAAGKVLDQLLTSIGVKRSDVYITNIVKDRPPGNRDPLPSEIDAYAPFLLQQIEIIEPKVIATLGRFSTKFILELFGLADQLAAMTKMHGRIFPAKTSFGQITIIPLYHPAVVLYNQSMQKILEKDFITLKQLI